MSFNPRAFFVKDKPDFVGETVQTFRVVSDYLMMNDLQSANYTLEVWEAQIANTLGRDDTEFKDMMSKVESQNQERYNERLKMYWKKAAEAQCPDILNKPTKQLTRKELLMKYAALIQLCNKRGIFFTPKKDVFL